MRSAQAHVAFVVALTASAHGCFGSTTSSVNQTGPRFSSVAVAAVGATTAVVTWVTDRAADSLVEYGTTTAYGQASAPNASLTTRHTVALSGLSPSTVYHFRVKSKDGAGNVAASGDSTFSTTAGTPPSVQLELAPAIAGFTTPLDLQQPNDGSGRLFVVEQGGSIKVVQPGGQVSVFIDLSAEPGFTSGGETGLLGLAFHPNYAVNGRFYVNYTRNAPQLQTVVAEYTASPASSDTAGASTERILFTVDQPFANHNGGGLAFGSDGFLYIGLGDGGSGGDPSCNGQNLATLLGKMLRIDVNAPPPAGRQYAVPAGNPFVGQAGARGEIWSYGLRNPFRFSFDKVTGDLFIGDVGQDRFEEVDQLGAQQGGANLGWNLFEGTHPFSNACAQTGNTLTGPIFDYPHAAGDNTVIGGYVYRGTSIPSLAGTYLFGDFGSGRIWTLAQAASGQWVRSASPVLLMGGGNVSAFGESQDGELYVVRYAAGEVARIREVGRAATKPAPTRDR